MRSYNASKRVLSAQIAEDVERYLAGGGEITYYRPGEYTAIAISIYNPHVEHRKKEPTYFDSAPASSGGA